MPDPKHSSDPSQSDPGGDQRQSWPKKFVATRDISFRLSPAHAKLLTEISKKAGASPSQVVRDMVVLSLQFKMRQRREGVLDGSN